MMTLEQAHRQIRLHAGFEPNANDDGLLARLRPYQPDHESSIANLLEALITIHKAIPPSASQVDRQLCAALWYTCEGCRNLALRPASPIRTNGLATDEELALLQAWIDAIELFAIRWLSGLDLPHCLSKAIELIAFGTFRSTHPFTFLLKNLPKPEDCDDPDIIETANCARAILEATTAGE